MTTISKNDNTLQDELLGRLFPTDDSSSVSVPINRYLSRSMRLSRSFSVLKSRVKSSFYRPADPSIYVMSADCGTGKTNKIQEVIKEWKEEGFHGSGAIIFVSTLEEIDSYISGSGLEKGDYAVCSPDEMYKTYGAGLHATNNVPVLFATHSKACKELLRRGSFTAAEIFHYNGEPRGARIWDEGFYGAEGATFTLYQLQALPNGFKRLGKEYARFLDAICQQVDRRIGATLLIPVEIIDVADKLYGSKIKVSDDVDRTLAALVKLAGSTAIVTDVDDGGECTLIGKSRSLPADIAPLFVLDASARLTGRYDQLSAHGMDVVRLEPATVAYDRLTIHWHDRGAGKTALRDKRERSTIFGIIAELANSKPTEAFLIVMAKEFSGTIVNERVTLHSELSGRITDPERVRITNWGRHHGTNEYRDISNVIIISDYRYPSEAYDAYALAAGGNESGCVTGEQRQAAMDEAFMSNVYQAVCRTSVRKREGGRSGAADAYFIMPDSVRRRDLINQAFPGCAIQTWFPVCPKTETKLGNALRILLQLMTTRSVLTKKELTTACGGKNASYLKPIYQDTRFQAELNRTGIHMGNNRFTRFIQPLVVQ